MYEIERTTTRIGRQGCMMKTGEEKERRVARGEENCEKRGEKGPKREQTESKLERSMVCCGMNNKNNRVGTGREREGEELSNQVHEE